MDLKKKRNQRFKRSEAVAVTSHDHILRSKYFVRFGYKNKQNATEFLCNLCSTAVLISLKSFISEKQLEDTSVPD